VGITEKPSLVPLDKLAEQYGFSPPREPGYNTVEACEAILDGKIRAFFMLGGNFVRAIPDRDRMEPAWRRMRLTVNVATKLNRSHLVHGEISFVLPVIGRIERDEQASGVQAVSMEDSTSCIHGSRGVRKPASRHLISEVKLVAELAKATLEPNPKVPWDDWVADYSHIRASIAEIYPDIFHGYERRMWEPGGFHRRLAARERVWKTKTGKANFITPRGLDEDLDMPEVGHDVLQDDHAAQQRPVQYDDLWLHRPIPRCAWHTHGGADASRRYRPARAHGRRGSDAGDRGERRDPARDGGISCDAVQHPGGVPCGLLPGG
jgi:anaerobic selenocysteine-containing dehydrogenase